MNKKIHFETIQKLFKEKYDAEPEVKLFENNGRTVRCYF